MSDEVVTCGTCHRACKLAPGKIGACRARGNADGAIVPASRMSRMSSSLIGVLLYFLIDLLPIIASFTSMLLLLEWEYIWEIKLASQRYQFLLYCFAYRYALVFSFLPYQILLFTGRIDSFIARSLLRSS